VKEPPADILRRLRPIPTDRPRAPARDIEGVDPTGTPVSVEIMGAAAPALLLFLSAACVGCRDLWEGLSEFEAGLADACRVAVVTRSPGDEDSSAVASLARAGARRGDEPDPLETGPVPVAAVPLPVVMSTAAYRDYRVDGPPFYAVVGPAAVLAEGVAWGVEATLRAVRAALVVASE
jgi:hypothetical protein